MAIVTEIIDMNGRELRRTYSDADKYIIQDETGIEYEEAVDPVELNRTYTESEDTIVHEDNDASQDENYIRAAKILLGEE